MKTDIVRQIGAVVREVGSREHEGRPARVVIATRSYDTTVEDAWDALTSAERIPRWFLPVTGDLRLGGRYQLQGNAGGTITRCEAPRLLAVTWEMAGSPSCLTISRSRWRHASGARACRSRRRLLGPVWARRGRRRLGPRADGASPAPCQRRNGGSQRGRRLVGVRPRQGFYPPKQRGLVPSVDRSRHP